VLIFLEMYGAKTILARFAETEEKLYISGAAW
jgi:hypothetical protein